MNLINRTPHMPLYLQLKERIQDEIVSGFFEVGDKIPTEKELEEKYEISRTTVRQAIEELVLEGLLYKRQGIGTFVSEPKPEFALGKLTSFTEDQKRRGYQPSSDRMSLDLVLPTLRVANKLEIAENYQSSQIYELIRLRFADNKPVGIHSTYFFESNRFSFDDVDHESKLQDFSLYRFFEKHGLYPVNADESIEAVSANLLEAELLEVSPKSPLLLVARTTYDNFSSPIEFSKMVYRADRYRYVVSLSR